MCHIERTIGGGAFGVVYLLQTTPSDQYALKVTCPRREALKDLDVEAEGKLLGKLCHPHLTQWCGHFLDGNVLYILTEFCKHGSLKSYLQEQQHHIEEILILTWTSQMADALRYLHGKNIIHRDLKTDNVFLQDEDNVKIGDFGIARELAFTLEEANTSVGTLPYMSPQVLDGQPYDSKSDMWGLGCCIHEMATLKQTFPSSFLELADKIKQGDIPPLPSIYTQELQYVVVLLLNQKASERPDALELQFYVTKITKKQFKPKPHVPLHVLDVTKWKGKIIQLVTNYTDSPNSRKDGTIVEPDGSPPDSMCGHCATLSASWKDRRCVQGHFNRTPTCVGLAKEARDWLRKNHTNTVTKMKNEGHKDSRCSSDSSVTVVPRRKFADHKQRKQLSKSESSSELPVPKEMKKAAYNIIQLYQHEDPSVMDMMLLSVLGERNFHVHRTALLEECNIHQ